MRFFSTPSSAEALPIALTARILKYVPQSQRLTQCSFVSQAWASAALIATQHLEHPGVSADAVPALESWLERHGAHLLSLQLSSSSYSAQHKLQLPLHKLAKLQRLQLKAFKLRLPGEENAGTEQEAGSLGPPSSSNSVVAAGTSDGAALVAHRHLQHLDHCQLFSINSLLQLAQVPQLTFLETREISLVQPCFAGRWGRTEGTAKQQLADALSSILQQLPRLTVLLLPGMPFITASAQHMAAMQGLQRVELELVQDVPSCGLQHLPGSVTQLQLLDSRMSRMSNERSSSLPAQLQHLTALLHLDLVGCCLPPTLLGSVTQLQHLHLGLCVLLPSEWHREFQTQGTAALLDALAKMTQLRHLHLELRGLDTVDTAPHRFSALTASSHLTQLTMDPDDRAPLPMGAVQHMFPAGRRMPAMRSLTISRGGTHRDPNDDLACMQSADIVSISRCCPSLQWLSICNVVRKGAQLSVLLDLPHSCEALLVGGTAFTDAAAPVLAQLTQLSYLCWNSSPQLTDAGLEPLTKLCLDRLYVYNCSISFDIIPDEDDPLDLTCGDEGTVAEQLDALLDGSPVCAVARLKGLRAHNQELQEKTDRLQRQLARSQARIRQLEQQLAAAQAGQSKGASEPASAL